MPSFLSIAAVAALLSVSATAQTPFEESNFNSTEALPTLTGHATVLLGAVKWTGDVALCIGTNTILDFICLLVNVDPVQERRVITDSSDETLVLCVWEGEEVS